MIRDEVDKAIADWRQGDCVLGKQWFLFRFHTDAPLTEAAAEAAQQGVDAAEAEVRGFMVATQTCDIVRSCKARPFVEVCPLVRVDPDKIKEIKHGYRPRYAFVPGIEEQGLVADLDRVMTVEKTVVASWERVKGCRNDVDRRNLSMALCRKRARTAFPDDFTDLASKLTRRMISKHDQDSDEGRALRSLREIRVRAAPGWEADEIHLFFWFIRNNDQADFENRGWDYWLQKWLELFPDNQGRFISIEGVVCTLDDLTARDFIESDPLDLDRLSVRGRRV